MILDSKTGIVKIGNVRVFERDSHFAQYPAVIVPDDEIVQVDFRTENSRNINKDICSVRIAMVPNGYNIEINGLWKAMATTNDKSVVIHTS